MTSSAENSKRRFRPRFFLETEGTAPTAVSPPAAGDLITLSAEDSRYSRTVLRARPGDPCEVVLTGSEASRAAIFDCSFSEISQRVAVRLERRRELPTAAFHLTLVQGLPQPKLLDEVVEKGTEVGVDRFLILPAEGSPPVPQEKLEQRRERLLRVAAAAARQSKQSAVPEVAAVSWDEMRALATGERAGLWLILEPAAQISMKERLEAEVTLAKPERVFLVVGPEGGWTEAELERLAGLGELVSLGRRILRTETAGRWPRPWSALR
ncbi:MAG TPA: RsmE family RNA methyltransferase [Thermoleophilia bacterium]|nr:RsmE family RNA methyltransferase [Thermoleophilia bacterium]